MNLARGFIVGSSDPAAGRTDRITRRRQPAVVVRMIQDAKARGTAIVAICHDLDVRDQIADRLFPVQPYREAA